MANSTNPESLAYIVAACREYERATRARCAKHKDKKFPNIDAILKEVDDIADTLEKRCRQLTGECDPPSDHIACPPPPSPR